MKSLNLMVAAAVAAATFSTGASALTAAQGAAAPVKLVVAGASAARDNFRDEFYTLCDGTDNDTYTSTTGTDFRAYTCVLGAPAGSLVGQHAVVYYRSEGGSIWGPGSVANNIQIKRLDLANCGLANAGVCAVTGYTLLGANSDNATSGVVDDNTELAVSDVEPSRFVGENWPATSGADRADLGSQPTASRLEAITTGQGFGQVFGALMNSTGGVTSTISNLRKSDIAGIYSGAITNWDQVPNAAGTGYYASAPITVCRRERGSGTQAAASIFFLGGGGCSSAPDAFIDGGASSNSTTSTLEVCVGNTANSIGVNIYKNPAPTNTKYVSIDGVAPSRTNAALGTYDYWFELAFAKRDNLASENANGETIANLIIDRATLAATIPSGSASAIALNNGFNIPALPIDPAKPVALTSKGGNSCSALKLQ
jgi:hypothetical protein